jgi:hypothetical protein
MIAEFIPFTEIVVWLSRTAVYYSLALFFGLMSIPQHPRADLETRLCQYFFAMMAAIFLYVALTWFPK